jgi:hypothetical protein
MSGNYGNLLDELDRGDDDLAESTADFEGGDEPAESRSTWAGIIMPD